MKTISMALCPVLSNRSIAAGVHDIWLETPQAELARAGQFVEISCEGHLLRRPISICEIDAKKARLRLLIEERGRGTHALGQVRPGETMNLLAPLGNGFPIVDATKTVVLVGGGIGTPPLLEASKPFAGHADAILGFRSLKNVVLQEDFKKAGVPATIATEDGSFGKAGFVTRPLEERLKKPCDVIFACGPLPMLKAVAGLANRANIPCFVSMEARMACGIGACLSCAITVRRDGREQYLHVCKNGPVFDANEIVW